MDPSSFPNPNGRFVRILEGGYGFVPNDLPPSNFLTEELYWLNSQADRALAMLEGIGTILRNPFLLINPFTYQEAISSSAIEETYTTISDLFLFELLLPESPIPEATREVANYLKALRYGFEEGRKLPFSLRLIRELHRILMTGVRGAQKSPGNFRKNQVIIGDPRQPLSNARFIPPPHLEMKAALSAFERFCHSHTMIPALIQSALMHYQFEVIHPFADGNGRVGRLLISIYLHDKGYLRQPLLFISRYFERTRQEYYRHLQEVSEGGHWQDWISYFLKGVEEQCRLNAEAAQRIIKLQKTFEDRLSQEGAPGRLFKILNDLFVFPFTNVKRVQAAVKVTYPTAQSDVDLLQKVGVLKEFTGRTRNRIYRVEELVKILES